MRNASLTFADHSECVALSDLVRSQAANPTGGRPRVLERRARLSLSEAPFDRVYRLDSGQLTIVGADEAGREVLLRTVAVGEWFGDYCLCPGQHWPHPALEARADERSRLTEVRHDRWLRDLATSPGAIRDFVSRTCVRLAQSDRRLIILARRSADERVGLLLLEHVVPDSDLQRGSVALTHEALATAAAMTRPHVTVTLGRFRRKGLIAYRRNESIVVHIAKLRAHVERVAARA